MTTDTQQREQPENIRDGEPYDDPAFEELSRAHDVWGRASGAQCAVFWMSGKRSQQRKGKNP